MKKNKIPLRKCIACGKRKPKKELIRIVKNNEKGAVIDESGKINGRGAYICSNMECVTNAEKSNRLSRALEIDIPKDIYDGLKEIIK
ncbi:MAG TPA: YlxR family protein [Tissierellaceae bacterium]|nr:YlxR family protein [Tissierellaceae bacterium]